MKIQLNGAAHETQAQTLEDLLAECQMQDMRCATAVNEAFVQAKARKQTLLAAGDRIEIVTPRQGG